MTEDNKDSLSDLYGVRFGPGNSNDREDEEEKEESQPPIADEGVNHEQQQEQEDDDRTHSEKLLDLANEANILLFKDQYRIPHALIAISGRLEILRVESNAFRRYLIKLYYDSEKKIIGSEAVKNVVGILQANAEYGGATFPLSLRVAWHNGDIYYDLTNDSWQCVKITKDGWELLDKTPIPMFTRYSQYASGQSNKRISCRHI
jgi:hypothetical protein